MDSIKLATIKRIFIYPVKSMRGIEVEEAFLTVHGLLGDRRYAFVQQGLAGTSGFPWLTGREKPTMLLHAPRFLRMPTPEDKDVPVRVRAPDGREYAVDDPELSRYLSGLLGQPVFLFQTKRGNFDTQQVSLISLKSVAALALESGSAIDPRQFRANFYIEPADRVPFSENDWVGRVLRVGERAQIGITQQDQRCMMINLNPETARQDPSVLRTVATKHEESMGIYGNVVVPGSVKIGDNIECV